MSNKKQRLKNIATANKLRRSLPPKRRCPYCKALIYDGHFVPPSLGEPGFFICDPDNPQDEEPTD